MPRAGAEVQDAIRGQRPPVGGGPGSHQWAEAQDATRGAETRVATRGRRPRKPGGRGRGGQWEKRGQYRAEFEMLVFTCVTGVGGGLGSVPPPESIVSLSLETFAGAAAGTETDPAGGRGGKEGQSRLARRGRKQSQW